MSTSTSINIQLTSNNTAALSTTKIVQLLLSAGWTLNDYGKTSYLPLGDNENFKWAEEDITPKALMNILEAKEITKEPGGVIITWQNTNIGGALLLWGEGKISLSLSVNRKILHEENNFKITDINWYLTKLLPPLNQGQLRIESFSYEEHI